MNRLALNDLRKVVVIGGGSGSFTLLKQFKTYFSELTALVNVADDGGSSGVLRDELGVLPPGDVRQCLVALSDSPKLRDLFAYRFDSGGLKGHSFGNLFLSAAEKTTHNFNDAVELAGNILRIRGRVLPITTDNIQLTARLASGKIIKGEYHITHHDFTDDPRPIIALEPAAAISAEARAAILAADTVVIAPGSLYGSLAPTLVVDGVRTALEQTAARVIYVCNLVTKPQQTGGFAVQDYVAEIERFIGAPVVDEVVFNTDVPSPEVLKKYTRAGEFLVGYDELVLQQQHYRAVGLKLIAENSIRPQAGDALAASRSLIRHDAKVLAQYLKGSI